MNVESRHIERLRGIIKFLDNTARNVLLYPSTHPSVHAPAQRMKQLLDEFFLQKDELLLGSINEVLYTDDYFFYEPTPASREILNCLVRFGVENIALRKGFTESEIIGLSRSLKSKGEGRDAFVLLLQQNKVGNASVRDFRLGGEGEAPTKGLETYRGAVSLISSLFADLRTGQLPPLREAEEVVGRFAEMVPAHRSLLLLLTSLKGYDTYTYQHSVNVGILTMLLAEKVGFDPVRMRHASLAGILHDIGKVKIPEALLNKPGRLSRDEWALMRRHPAFSAEIVSGMGGDEQVVQGVAEHHCYFDGTGYPTLDHSRGASEIARIISVADAYDAITTVRSYKDPVDPLTATRLLDGLRGTQLDAAKVDSFLGMMGIHPPGCMIRLSSNEVAQVIRTGTTPGRPWVRMVLDANNLPFVRAGEVDLSAPANEELLVAGLVEPVLYGLEVDLAPSSPGAGGR